MALCYYVLLETNYLHILQTYVETNPFAIVQMNIDWNVIVPPHSESQLYKFDRGNIRIHQIILLFYL